MADNDDDLPDNVIAFQPRVDGAPLQADLLLEECIGCYDGVVVVGINEDGELEISSSVGGAAETYRALSEAVTRMGLTHIDMAYQGTCH